MGTRSSNCPGSQKSISSRPSMLSYTRRSSLPSEAFQRTSNAAGYATCRSVLRQHAVEVEVLSCDSFRACSCVCDDACVCVLAHIHRWLAHVPMILPSQLLPRTINIFEEKANVVNFRSDRQVLFYCTGPFVQTGSCL